MKFTSRHMLFAVVAVFGVVATLGLNAASYINSTVAVCAPMSPANCAAPDSSGAMPVTMASAPAGGATDANLTAFKTANHTDLAALLTGPLSVGQSGAWSVTANLSGAVDNVIGTATLSAAGAATITGSAPFGTTSFNMQGYAGVDIYFTTVGGGAATFALRCSGDGSTFKNVPVSITAPSASVGSANIVAFTPTTTMILHSVNASGICQLNSGSYDSGTYTAFIVLKVLPQPATVQSIVGNVASAVTDAGAPVKVGCKYNSTPIALTNGQRGDAQCTPTGAFLVEQGGKPFCNIVSATTTTCKSGAGYLHTLCMNTVVASGTVTLYDNTAGSGTKIATITNPAALLGMGPLCAVYDLAFSTGLTAVTTGTQDITLTYR